MLIYSSSISFFKNLKIHKKSLEPVNIPASEYDQKDLKKKSLSRYQTTSLQKEENERLKVEKESLIPTLKKKTKLMGFDYSPTGTTQVGSMIQESTAGLLKITFITLQLFINGN